jgi:hypothetical protein
MKKLTILGIVSCIGLIIMPDAVIYAAGPPSGLEVKVINEQPIQVTGDIGATVSGDVTVTNDANNPVEVTGDVQVNNQDDEPIPVKIVDVGSSKGFPVNITILNGERYTVPVGNRLHIKYVSMLARKGSLGPEANIVGAMMNVYSGPDLVGCLGVFAPFNGPYPLSTEGGATYAIYNIKPFEVELEEGLSIRVVVPGNNSPILTPVIDTYLVGELVSVD